MDRNSPLSRPEAARRLAPAEPELVVWIEPLGPDRRRVRVGPYDKAVLLGYLERVAGKPTDAGFDRWQPSDSDERTLSSAAASLDRALAVLLRTRRPAVRHAAPDPDTTGPIRRIDPDATGPIPRIDPDATAPLSPGPPAVA